MSRHDDGPRLNDWFCGAGGSTQASATIPGVGPVHAANHWDRAIQSHAANFPDVDHHRADIRDIDVSTLPYAELFWASPECPQWSQPNGKTRTYTPGWSRSAVDVQLARGSLPVRVSGSPSRTVQCHPDPPRLRWISLTTR